MLVERRRSALTPDLLIRVGLMWVLVSALILLNNIHQIGARLYPDPDDMMRLVQVRDLLAGQSWFDLTQYRVNAPGGGVDTHWSRLVDLPLAALIFILTPVLGQSSAEMAALIAVPLITLLLAMMLAARIAWRLIGEEEAGMTCVAMALSMPLLFQFGPMRIDHHGWQIVCALLAVNALMAREAKVGGLLAGFAMAAWLAISIEGAPMVAVITALVALRWLRDRSERSWMVWTMAGLASGSAALHLLTRGFDFASTPCDAVGSGHLAAMTLVAIVSAAIARAEPLPRALVAFGLALGAAGALGVLAWTQQGCFSGGPLGMDPLLHDLWYVKIREGLPIWDQSISMGLQIVILPLFGILASLKLMSQSRSWLRRWWANYAVILIAALIMALLIARASSLAAALAAPPLGWQIRLWFRKLRQVERPREKFVAAAVFAFAVLPILQVAIVAVARPAHAAIVGTAPPSKPARSSTCSISQNAQALSALPTGEIFAPLDIGPSVLLNTSHSVIATGHHRGAEGMRLVINLAMGSGHEAKAALAERGTDYVALCPDLNEARMYARLAPDGFMADLREGKAPDWLEPVPLGSDSALKVWRIRAD